MKQLSWQTVATLAVLGGVTVGLAGLTDMTAEQITALVAVLGGIAAGSAVGGAVAGGVQSQVNAIAAETQAQTPVLAQVAHRVNGELDARIKMAVDDGNADLIRLLREQGVIR